MKKGQNIVLSVHLCLSAAVSFLFICHLSKNYTQYGAHRKAIGHDTVIQPVTNGSKNGKKNESTSTNTH